MVPYCQDSSACAQEEDLGSNRVAPEGQEENLSAGIVRLRKLWHQESLELKRIKHLSDEELECLSP